MPRAIRLSEERKKKLLREIRDRWWETKAGWQEWLDAVAAMWAP